MNSLFGPVNGDSEATRRLAGRFDLLLAFFLFLAAMVGATTLLVVLLLARGVAVDDLGDTPLDIGLSLAVQAGVQVLLVVVALTLASAGRWGSVLGALRALPWYLLFLVAWLPFSFGLLPAVLEQFGVAPNTQDHLLWFTADPPPMQLALALIGVTLVAPLFEELVFRGYLWRGLDRLAGRSAALWGSAVLFGLFHQSNFLHVFLPLTLFGAFLAWLRRRFDSLTAPLIAHAVHNSWTVALAMSGLVELPKSGS